MDVVKWLAKGFSISYLLLIIMIFGVSIPVSLSTGDPVSGFFIGIMFTVLMAFSLPFMIPLLFAMAGLRYWVVYRNCKNRVRIRGGNLYVTIQRAPLFPMMDNKIPVNLIDRIECPEQRYLPERRKRTPLWYRIMSMYHRIPLGGLYLHHTSKSNLLVMYLKEPVSITNNEIKILMHTALNFDTLPVKEVIINIRKRDQDRFRKAVGPFNSS